MRIIFVFFVLLLPNLGFGQMAMPKVYPRVGEPCPDFTLNNIAYYPKKQASLHDFRGKWLVLDFWTEHCGGCIVSFPKVSAMQEQFGEKVQFMMVGPKYRDNFAEHFYSRYRDRENLLMPCAFDSVLANHQWDIPTTPHLVIIDDKGIVRGITVALYKEQIEEFLIGGNPDLMPKNDPGDTIDHRIPWDDQRPFLVNGNGGVDSAFLYRSIISRVNLARQHAGASGDLPSAVKSGRIEMIGYPLDMLFNYAYFGNYLPAGEPGDADYGKIRNRPILEIQDSSVFEYSVGQSKNLFAYSLILPIKNLSQQKLLEGLQHDLCQNFGYTASIETRKLPCWRLTANPDAIKNLLSKKDHQPTAIVRTKSGFKAKNYPFINILQRVYGVAGQKEVIYDDTGISGRTNIDVTIEDDLWLNMDDVVKAVHSIGLELLPSDRQMKVLVIRDQK